MINLQKDLWNSSVLGSAPACSSGPLSILHTSGPITSRQPRRKPVFKQPQQNETGNSDPICLVLFIPGAKTPHCEPPQMTPHGAETSCPQQVFPNYGFIITISNCCLKPLSLEAICLKPQIANAGFVTQKWGTKIKNKSKIYGMDLGIEWWVKASRASRRHLE